MKYYAIKDNDKSEIYNSWEECQESIKTFNNPKYKSFSSKFPSYFSSK